MARAVKAVSANPILFIVMIRNPVHVRMAGHRLMERRIEDANLRNIREGFRHGFNSHEIRGVVQWGKRDTFLQGGDDFMVYENRSREFLSPVYDPVTYRFQFFERGDHSVGSVQKRVKDHTDGDLVIRDRRIDRYGVHAGLGMFDPGSFDADPLDEPLRQDLFVRHREKLIFQRRTSAIQNKNFHTVSSLFLDGDVPSSYRTFIPFPESGPINVRSDCRRRRGI